MWVFKRVRGTEHWTEERNACRHRRRCNVHEELPRTHAPGFMHMNEFRNVVRQPVPTALYAVHHPRLYHKIASAAH
eukprot:35505-Eustigmatos_ZCMA.PRE.1